MKFLEEILTRIPQDDSADRGEQLFLYGLVRAIRPTVAVETGTHRGKTSLIIGHALMDNEHGHLHTADPYDWEQEKNLEKFLDIKPYITYYRERGSFLGTKLRKIDFLFIDGFHEKDEVLEEWDALSPHLTENAIVVFHDCAYPSNEHCDVNGAVKELGLTTVWVPTRNRLRIYEHSGK